MSLTVDHNGSGVVTLAINRPHRMNAIDPETDILMRDAWAQLERDDTVRCAILTGAGSQAFCAGADIETMLPHLKSQAIASRDDGTFCGMTRVCPISKPIIAAINGVAFGGGLEIALACDIRVASENARFALPEVQLGILAGGGGVTRLARYISPALAAEMLLTGDSIDAETALRVGLVSRVVPVDALMGASQAIAKRIAANAPLAVERTLHLLRKSRSILLGDALDMERQGFRDLISTSDAQEAITAFRAKRQPNFTRR